MNNHLYNKNYFILYKNNNIRKNGDDKIKRVIIMLLLGVFIVGISISGCINNSTENTDKSQLTVKYGDIVTVDYIGMYKNGTVFDTSIESVAKKNGIYNPQRDYKPITFKVGDGKLIKGFEEGVIGMKKGESKIIVIPPDKGYGYPNKKLIVSFPRGIFNGTNITPEVGKVVLIRNYPGKIVKVNETTVVIDFNSPLSGKTLKFNITVLDIQRPTNVQSN